jgi:hypothetical protein
MKDLNKKLATLSKKLATHFKENNIYHGTNILSEPQILAFLSNLISKNQAITKQNGFTVSKVDGGTKVEYADKLITLSEHIPFDDEIPFLETGEEE